MMDSSSAKNRSGTQVIARAAALLRELAVGVRDGHRLLDLAQRLGLERPTVHRILQGLVQEGLVIQDPRTRAYRLGALTYELGLAAAPSTNLVDGCSDALTELARLTGDTVFLTARSDADVVCLDRREGSFPIKAMILDVGQRRPLGVGASSIAILSALDHDQCAGLLTRNAQRLAAQGEPGSAELLRMVHNARDKGYALKDPPGMPEIRSIGVPITSARGKPLCAISVSTLTDRITSREAALAMMMQRVADDLRRKLHRLGVSA
ncbi:MAG: Transcriptional regulator, IclR family [Burkholderia sp.]|nr:Transcriptional regulator, IclR family [Burkholderia sp.]